MPQGGSYAQAYATQMGHATSKATVEDQVLSLAKLVKTQQACIEDVDSKHAATLLGHSGRIKIIEKLVQDQFVGSANAELPAIKALTDRVVQLDEQMVNGFQEQQFVHQHNAAVLLQLGERLARLEQANAEANLKQLTDLKSALAEPLLQQVQSQLESLEARADARLLSSRIVSAATSPASSSDGSNKAAHADMGEALSARLIMFEELLHKGILHMQEGITAATQQPAIDVAQLDQHIREAAALQEARVQAAKEALQAQLATMQQQLDKVQAAGLARQEAQQFVRAMGIIGSIQGGMSAVLRQLDSTVNQLAASADALWKSQAAMLGSRSPALGKGAAASAPIQHAQLVQEAKAQISALQQYLDKSKMTVHAAMVQSASRPSEQPPHTIAPAAVVSPTPTTQQHALHGMLTDAVEEQIVDVQEMLGALMARVSMLAPAPAAAPERRYPGLSLSQASQLQTSAQQYQQALFAAQHAQQMLHANLAASAAQASAGDLQINSITEAVARSRARAEGMIAEMGLSTEAPAAINLAASANSITLPHARPADQQQAQDQHGKHLRQLQPDLSSDEPDSDTDAPAGHRTQKLHNSKNTKQQQALSLARNSRTGPLNPKLEQLVKSLKPQLKNR